MSTPFTRRTFLATATPLMVGSSLAATPTAHGASDAPRPQATAGVPHGPSSAFPAQDAALVREMVGVSHGNIARVRELLERQPALARAAYDWGFGDWETALGAASHVGHRAIAELLLAHGARPSIFSAAMLGQIDVVKAFVTAWPGVQKIKGPHGITLMAHARAGGEPAKPVVSYLESVGDADLRTASLPVTDEERTAILGTYPFGTGSSDAMDVTFDKNTLFIARRGGPPRNLTHVGGLAFFPAGAEAVRIRFERTASTTRLSIHDPDEVLKVDKKA